ncbi:MAG: glycosyltransferase family 39 protein [Pseudomonadota bacterium]
MARAAAQGAIEGAAMGGPAADADWARRALIALAALTAARLVFLASGVAPVHFDEAQYWTYGETLDWGYYSKPPLSAWIIRLFTDVLGDTAFGLRAASPLIHAWIAWLIFASARRLFDARVGFWSALLYLTLPGVAVSSALMTTDPPMMLGWAGALYALTRAGAFGSAAGAAGESAPAGAAAPGAAARIGWWALAGAAVGAGLLGKYTMIAFVGGLLGFALFGARRAPFAGGAVGGAAGPLAALLAGLAVFGPNIAWNAANDFAAFSHVVDNAKLGGSGPAVNLGKGFGFMIAQAGVFGPIALAALGAALALALSGRWAVDRRHLALFWLAAPLPILMTLQAFMSRAHPNWAAPAYVAGAILVALWLLGRPRGALWLGLSAAIGIGVSLGFWALTAVYDAYGRDLPRLYDPFKRSRLENAVCARALPHLEGRLLYSNDRRIVASCLLQIPAPMERARIAPRIPPKNHYQLAIPLDSGDPREMVLAMRFAPETAEGFARRFESWRLIEEGEIRTHGDRADPYSLYLVRGARAAADEAPAR